jgi:hypothetical protein
MSRGDPGGGPCRAGGRKLPPGRSGSRNGGGGTSGWAPRGPGSGPGAWGNHPLPAGVARSSSFDSSADGLGAASRGTKSTGGREGAGGLGGAAGSGFGAGGSYPASSGPVQPSSLRNASSRSVTANLLRYQTTRTSSTLKYQLHRLWSIAYRDQGAPQPSSKLRSTPASDLKTREQLQAVGKRAGGRCGCTPHWADRRLAATALAADGC